MKNNKKTFNEYKKEFYKKFSSSNLKLISFYDKNNILVKDHFGICNMSKYTLLNKALPNIKSAIDKTDYFINQARKIHGDRYDYSKCVYKKSHEKLCIICKKHGEFWTTASSHTSNKSNCPKCNGGGKFYKKDFVDKCNLIHNYKYDYSLVQYVTNLQKVKIICPIHGEFEQRAMNHLRGDGCSKCGFIKSNLNKKNPRKNTFFKKCKELYGDVYDYSVSEYKNMSTKIEIICKNHGKFLALPASHINKRLKTGCPICGMNNKKEKLQNNPSGWSLTNWKNAAEKSKNFDSFKVYLLECWNDKERFFKIGRTYVQTKRRLIDNSFPYNFTILKEITGDCECIFKLETKLKQQNKKNKYLPQIKFGGMYECFSDIKNLKLLQELIKNCNDTDFSIEELLEQTVLQEV